MSLCPGPPGAGGCRHSQLGPQHWEEAFGAQRIEWTSLHLPAGIWLSHIEKFVEKKKKKSGEKKTSSDVLLVGW